MNRVNDFKKELIDQTAHLGVVMIVLVPLFVSIRYNFELQGCVLSGFLLGLVIEVKERGSTITVNNIIRGLKSWVDLAGYAFGGALLGLIIKFN